MKIQTQLVPLESMSIPTLLFKKDGQVVKQVAGVHTAEQIKAIVAELS